MARSAFLGPPCQGARRGDLFMIDKLRGSNYNNAMVAKKEMLLRYLAGNAGDLPEDELSETVSRIFEGGGDNMATLAEKWKREGKKEGKREGKKEGKKEARWELVENSLKVGLPVQTIGQITGLPIEKISRFKEKHALNPPSNF